MNAPREKKIPMITPQPDSTPEHGDWRCAVDGAPDIEKSAAKSQNLFKRLYLRASYLEATSHESYLDELRHYQYAEEQNSMIEPIDGLKRVGRIFWGIVILLPLSLMTSYALIRTLMEQQDWINLSSILTSEPVWFALVGACSLACIFFAGIFRPILLFFYVLGHEATHVIFSYLCFRKVSSFKVGLDGGYVDTEADNPLVALSPYFFPIWLVLFSSLLWGINLIIPIAHYEKLFYASFGFWLAFHVYWTLWIIPREQPDFLENGILFSALYIWVMNMGMLILLFALFDVITFSSFAENFLSIAHKLFEMASRAL